MDVNEVAAQIAIFFVAGFETSSATMTFCLFELARNPKVQRKVQADIDAALSNHGGVFTYEALQEMTYLDNCIDETLRMYPPLAVLQRECIRDYRIPDSNVVIPTGTMVFLPVFGFHRDKSLYPEPSKFIPERFTDPSYQETLKTAYYPFGDGPRTCIGRKLGKIQAKLGLCSLLAKFNLELTNKQDPMAELEFGKNFTLTAKNDIYLIVKRR